MVIAMVTKRRPRVPPTLPAGEFKAKCLQVMDSVAETGNTVVITKRGRPIARLVPVEDPPATLAGFLAGKIEIEGDIVAPLDKAWDAFE